MIINLGLHKISIFLRFTAIKKKVLEQEWQKAITQTKLSKIETRKLVTQVFYQILLLNEQKTILSRTDTLYAEFLEKSKLRFEKGAGNILEKTTAEIQFENISNQLKWLENEIDLAKIQLQWLLNSDIRNEPTADNFIIDVGLLSNDISTENHPLIELSQQEIEQSKLQVQLEKSKLLPDLSLSYYNQSFRDIDPHRYNVVAIGIGIPIFASGQKANIKAEQQKNCILRKRATGQKGTVRNGISVGFECLSNPKIHC